MQLLHRHPQGLGVGRLPVLLLLELGQIGGGEAPVVLGGPGLGEGVVGGRLAGGVQTAGGVSSSTVKPRPERLMSSGRTSSPKRRASFSTVRGV